jgi:prepilin-type N-terminal cleavage/methylation domain-containing protein
MKANVRFRRSRGFTLLEVLLATSIMAVGTTSVLVVIATAAGMASQRQVNVRREQVMDEARHDAQQIVDTFRVPRNSGVTVLPAKAPGKPAAKAEPAAAPTIPGKVDGKRSTRFDGFTYDLTFDPRDRNVPEKGYDVTIVVHYGGGELSATTQTTLIATTIAEEEFASSMTYEEEKLGIANRDKPRER